MLISLTWTFGSIDTGAADVLIAFSMPVDKLKNRKVLPAVAIRT